MRERWFRRLRFPQGLWFGRFIGPYFLAPESGDCVLFAQFRLRMRWARLIPFWGRRLIVSYVLGANLILLETKVRCFSFENSDFLGARAPEVPTTEFLSVGHFQTVYLSVSSMGPG